MWKGHAKFFKVVKELAWDRKHPRFLISREEAKTGRERTDWAHQ